MKKLFFIRVCVFVLLISSSGLSSAQCDDASYRIYPESVVTSEGLAKMNLTRMDWIAGMKCGDIDELRLEVFEEYIGRENDIGLQTFKNEISVLRRDLTEKREELTLAMNEKTYTDIELIVATTYAMIRATDALIKCLSPELVTKLWCPDAVIKFIGGASSAYGKAQKSDMLSDVVRELRIESYNKENELRRLEYSLSEQELKNGLILYKSIKEDLCVIIKDYCTRPPAPHINSISVKN